MTKQGIGALAQSTIFYGLGSVVNRSLSLLLLPLFTRYLTAEEYGVSTVLNTLALLMTGPFSLGTVNAIGICYFAEADQDNRARVLWTAALVVALNAAALTALGVMARHIVSNLALGTPVYGRLVVLALLSIAAQCVADTFWAGLRIEQRARTFVTLSIVASLMTVGLTVWLLVGLRGGLTGLFEATAIARLLTLAMLVAVTSRTARLGVDIRRAPALVRIGSPTIFALAAFFIIDFADRVMLQRMVGVAEAGIYAVGYTFGMVVAFAVDAFGSAWSPFYLSFIGRQREAEMVFGRVLRIYLAVFGFGWLAYTAVSTQVVKVLTAPSFHGAADVVPVIALAYLCKGIYLIVLPGLYFARRLDLQVATEMSAAAITIALNLILIPIFHRQGAAISTCLAYCSLPLLAGTLSQRYLHVRYDSGRLAAITAGLCGSGLAVAVASTWPAMWSIPVVLGVLVTFAALSLSLGFDSDDRQTIISFLRLQGIAKQRYGRI